MPLNFNILDAFAFEFIHVTNHTDVSVQLNPPQSVFYNHSRHLTLRVITIVNIVDKMHSAQSS